MGYNCSGPDMIEYHDIADDCKCERSYCPVCSGLSIYLKCGCAEIELLSYCPGFFIEPEDRQAIVSGKVIDFESRVKSWKRKKRLRR